MALQPASTLTVIPYWSQKSLASRVNGLTALAERSRRSSCWPPSSFPIETKVNNSRNSAKPVTARVCAIDSDASGELVITRRYSVWARARSLLAYAVSAIFNNSTRDWAPTDNAADAAALFASAAETALWEAARCVAAAVGDGAIEDLAFAG